jgi:hypothetical protein
MSNWKIMNRGIDVLEEFLEDHDSYYRNSHNIEFDLLDGSVLVSYTADRTVEQKTIEFFLSYEEYTRCSMSEFRVKVPKDFDKVTVDQLWDVFRQGNGRIYCGIEDNVMYFPVYYRYIDQKLFAMDDQESVKVEVIDNLESVNDFMNYTYKLFQNSSNSPQNSSFLPHSSL